MVETKIYTIAELLLSPALKYNQTLLARIFGCSRSTIAKYVLDTEGKEHMVRAYGTRYQLMTVPSSTKKK